MKTANTLQAQVQSKLILGAALIFAASAISLAFQHSGNAKTMEYAYNDAPVQQVVIEAKRMTADEKLAFDETSQAFARVEIVGKRLSAEEKLAMNAEDELAAKQAVAHRKA